MIRHLDLFSGIGGFSLAASWTGVVEPAGFCEIDPWCRRVLAKHWPGVPQHDDIKTLTGQFLRGLGRIDLVTGGFPCQPFSIAGLRRGTDDDRYLWPAMAAVIAETRPTYVLAENSPNIRSMVLDDIYDDLESLGYAVGSPDLPAGAVGAAQRRYRMWIWAYLEREGKPHAAWPGQERRWSGDGAAIAIGSGDDGPGLKEQRHAIAKGAVQPGPQRHIGWPSGSGILRRVHGVPHRVDRLRGLGNAVVPQVAYEVLRVMLDLEVAPCLTSPS